MVRFTALFTGRDHDFVELRADSNECQVVALVELTDSHAHLLDELLQVRAVLCHQTARHVRRRAN